MARRKVIEVSVSRRILWVGAEAYPLHNIARVTTVKLVPRRGAAVWRFLKFVPGLVILAIIAAAVSAAAGDSTVSGLAVTAVFVVALVAVVRLVRVLTMKTLHGLVIEASGSAHTALASTDKERVHWLVGQITDAINNPQAEFQITIDNRQYGDNVFQVGGTGNVGVKK